MKMNGGIEAFDFNLVFKDCGKLGDLYNDDSDFDLRIDGHDLHISRNVVLVDLEYEMTWLPTYDNLRECLQIELDEILHRDYNYKW